MPQKNERRLIEAVLKLSAINALALAVLGLVACVLLLLWRG